MNFLGLIYFFLKKSIDHISHLNIKHKSLVALVQDNV